MLEPTYNPAIAQRFRGFLPVVVDVETGGFEAERDALLEIAAVIIRMEPDGRLIPTQPVACHVQPFPGAHIDPRALAFNGIDPFHPFRDAKSEREALRYLFTPVRQAVKDSGCNKAILVGHNAPFDLGFLRAAVARTGIKRNPFHSFSTLDTVSLSALAYGHTVLARSTQLAGLGWDNSEAHTAIYDANKTAELFCAIFNRWDEVNRDKPWLREDLSDSEE